MDSRIRVNECKLAFARMSTIFNTTFLTQHSEDKETKCKRVKTSKRSIPSSVSLNLLGLTLQGLTTLEGFPQLDY